MTQAQENFLNILRMALHHEQTEIQLPDGQWREILEISIKQHLLPVIAEAIPWTQEHFAENDILIYRQYAIRQTTTEAGRTLDFHALYRSLRQKGLHPVVVKGVLCSRLYPWRFHRISADNDLHISETELLACHHAMLAYGLHTETSEERLEQEDEITYQDEKKRLYIEVHRSLFDTSEEAPDDLNIFFKDAVKNAVEMDGFLAMPPHEHFLYLLLHAYKHFIYSGVGIRQTCDIALWAQRYAGQIRWERLLEECRRVHAERFAAAQFRIAERYLGCSLPLPDCWLRIEVDAEPLLEDMFAGGVHGASDLTRLHTATVTLNAIRKDRTGEKAGILRSIFPTREYMAGRYPYAGKYPLLLPVAWGSRIWGYLCEIRKDDSSSASDSLHLAKERIALLKYYGVIS